jgi:putative FmdB family regulatory protein
MPLYTYTCREHGEFSGWGQMATSEQPQSCPTCAAPAPRALAHPAVGGRSEAAGLAGGDGCGQGMCAAPAPMGHACGAGCVH